MESEKYYGITENKKYGIIATLIFLMKSVHLSQSE